MNNKRATKRALLTSIMALVMCVVMLVGTTFAWFTDTASTGVNKIVAGNLKVDLEYAKAWDDAGAPTEWAKVEENTKLTFRTADSRDADEIFWEPNCTYKLPELRVVNNGNLAIKYKMVINGINGDAELNQVIDWTFNGVNMDTDYVLTPAQKYSDIITISGHMQESAGNTYMGKTIENIFIKVYATQAASEYDSINNTYDQNATYPEDVTSGGTIETGATTYAELKNAIALLGRNNLTLNIGGDIAIPEGETWTPISVDGSVGNGTLTINGNGHKITGLNAPLVANTWAGKSNCIIKGLTLEKANIVVDENDEEGNVGVGAFISVPSASETIILEDCKLIDSTVKGGHWAGGLIGVSGGYNGSDGPVFENVTIKNCSVTGSIIESKGSVGAIFGHAAWDNATHVEITGCTVTGNTVTSTGSSNNKAGSLMGTVGCAGNNAVNSALEPHADPGVFVTACNVSDNNVTSNGTTIDGVYGRQGSTGGKLVVDGVTKCQ